MCVICIITVFNYFNNCYGTTPLDMYSEHMQTQIRINLSMSSRLSYSLQGHSLRLEVLSSQSQPFREANLPIKDC
jgi:hypothetical protein